jgi:outer membrane protein
MNVKKKSLAVLFSALTVMMLVSGCGKAKLGYIDQSRLQKESPQIEAVLSEWDQKMADLQKESAETLSPDKTKGMSDDELKKAQQQVQMKAMALNQQYQSQLKAKVDAAIDEIAKNKKLDAVVDSEPSTKLVVSGGVDITDEVIQKLK